MVSFGGTRRGRGQGGRPPHRSRRPASADTPGRRFTSWAATGSRNARPRRRRWAEDDPDLARERGGTSPNLAEVLRTKGLASITGAMQCKLFIEEAWQAWRTSPGRERGEGVPAVRWHWRSFALLAVLVLAVAVGSASL